MKRSCPHHSLPGPSSPSRHRLQPSAFPRGQQSKAALSCGCLLGTRVLSKSRLSQRKRGAERKETWCEPPTGRTFLQDI